MGSWNLEGSPTKIINYIRDFATRIIGIAITIAGIKFFKAVPDTVLDMINAVYHGQAFYIYQGHTFEFIKAVSDTVLDMINAAYRGNPLVFTRAIRLSLSRLFLTLY